jgi:hypothetical protein
MWKHQVRQLTQASCLLLIFPAEISFEPTQLKAKVVRNYRERPAEKLTLTYLYGGGEKICILSE